ncbi:Uma2 family endonuclease [Gloeobacter morelensis]|uniref:Uma2 family endonuclease n=1 Tax=Gloeobacter morelensis MG652769 TaxID=2781736 RepID=A0ABY3PIG2_9CYAN|nr:Uma2 family endonuclease [Gloeobacter morelensis]UFP93451.1 Uma2 family endonuclease [Gloeobacter morelensis MG652769]
MVFLSPLATDSQYPSGDGEPVAETFVHLYAILLTLEVLRQYLAGRQAAVLANQFLYYAQGYPKLRVAPDVMVIFEVAPGGRDSFKIWEEGQVPAVVFEITSKKTQDKDLETKRDLYESLGVREYWLFDPKGEWIDEKLLGYRLARIETEVEPTERYIRIRDGRSEPLGLRLQTEGDLIGFYREDTGQKLLIPSELAEELARENQARRQAEQRAEVLAQRLRELGVDPDTL